MLQRYRLLSVWNAERFFFFTCVWALQFKAWNFWCLQGLKKIIISARLHLTCSWGRTTSFSIYENPTVHCSLAHSSYADTSPLRIPTIASAIHLPCPDPLPTSSSLLQQLSAENEVCSRAFQGKWSCLVSHEESLAPHTWRWWKTVEEMSKELLQVPTCRGWSLLGQGRRGRRAVPGEIWALCEGASCWEREQPADGQEEGDVLQGFVKQIQLTAPEAAQLGSALSHNSKKQVKMILNEQNRPVRNIMLINMTHYLFQHSVFTQMVVYLPDIILFELFLFHGVLMKDLAMIIYTEDQFILPAEKCSSLHNLHMLLSKDLFSYSNISWRISLLLVIFSRH